MQVTEERRVYKRRSIRTNAVVVCQEWPGWLFSLGPLGWGNIYVFCDIVLDDIIKDYLGDKDWIKGWTCVKDIANLVLLPPRENSVAWLSGDKGFVDRLRPVFNEWRVVAAVHGVRRGNLSSLGTGALQWTSESSTIQK